MRAWLFLPAAVFFLLPVVYGLIHRRTSERRERLKAYDAADRACGRALESRSLETVRRSLADFQAAYQTAEADLDAAGKALYKTDLADLQAHLADLERADWLRKAEKPLMDFAEQYELVTGEALEGFRDAELLLRAREKCLAAWQRYFAVDLTPYETRIQPKDYLRTYMGEGYDPCMASRDALANKLDACVRAARPEYLRKKRLYALLVRQVADRESMLRSELLGTDFSGFTAAEIKCCYRALLTQNRLYEYKMGSRWFVSLSDREKGRGRQTDAETQ